MKAFRPYVVSLFVLCGLLPLNSLAQEAGAPWVEASMSVSPQRIYIHSQVTLTLTISSRNVRLSNNFNLNGLPPLTVMQLAAFKELPIQRVNSGGTSTEIRRFQCEGEALLPGPLNLAPQLRYGVLTRERGFFGNLWREAPQTLQVPPLNIHILPLPAQDRPDFFSGAIGQFQFDATVTPTDLEVEELIEFTMQIRGQGYVKDVILPEMAPGRHFKVYPRQIEATEGEGISITQTMIPQSTNATEVPGVKFCFFDPIKGQYITTQRGPFPLTYHSHRALDHAEPYRRPVSSTSTGATERTASASTGKHASPGSALEDRSQALHTTGVILSGLGGLFLLVAAVYGIRAIRNLRAAISAPARPGRISIILFSTSIVLIVASAVLYRMAAIEIPKSLVLRNVSSYLGPSSQGLVLFELPKNARVHLLETAGSWTQVGYGKSSGWIPSDALADITPPRD
ncbi:MAG: hypothetical protein O3C57_00605 [Verrucomicrobia bacterium]|nr:hypothetical protein [Verrucomicrobiota bacterium]